ncbi:hypothetical protein H8N03_22560 [Ramlibacter sp. USB13]|uniref:Uncharacterized protein n=1 Tax=Ramlibacter cellulosilyticus TaxID=2764187 RepID=A0A923SD76_9BURK|nr:hypothetical protein [Ramlibacter cellulosilyticus]MBC5785741.1 hypothetical protein [Ramlibacter cellulosilyticus]
MIALPWIVFALLAVFWTGGAWIMVALLQWVMEALASGAASQAAREVAPLQLPEWMKVWIDPDWLPALQGAVQSAIDGAGAVLPLATLAAAWLVPAVWVTWALGMIVLLATAVGAHILVRRFAQRRAGRPPAPGMA